MAKECLIIGQPNAGKTLFMVNFIEFLGYASFNLMVSYPQTTNSYTLSMSNARSKLVSEELNFTRKNQSAKVRLPIGKGIKKFIITDTVGLSDGIHSEMEVRKAMADTIAMIKNSKFILHLIDVAAIGASNSIRGLKDIDLQITQFSHITKSYMILANKIDLPKADIGYEILSRKFPDVLITPISALYKTGFTEVKANVGKFF